MRRVAWGAVLVAGLWLLAVSGRSFSFSRKAARLVAVAQAFPKDYRVGQGHEGDLLVLGDSTALGVGVDRVEDTLGALVASSRGGGRVIDLGVSGVGALAVRDEQLPRAPRGSLPCVLISVTANDATRGTSPSDVQDDLADIFEALEKRGVKRTVVTTTPNFVDTPALPWPLSRVVVGRAEGLAKTIRIVAARYPFVRVADLSVLGTLAFDEYAADGFHPNAAGYRRWAEIVSAAMR